MNPKNVGSYLVLALSALAVFLLAPGCGSPYYVQGQDEYGDIPDSLRVLIESKEHADKERAERERIQSEGVEVRDLGVPEESPLPLEYTAESAYLLRRGDKIEVDVLFYPELRNVSIVRPDGMVTAPGLGDVRALGRRPEEVAADIEAFYSRILRDPTTTVNVLSFGERRAYVFGWVEKPGALDLQQRITVTQALASAGSPDPDAKLSSVVLIRRRSENTARAFQLDLTGVLRGESLAADVVLQPDDVVYVPRTFVSSLDQFVDHLFAGLIPIPDLFVRSYDAIHVDQRAAIRRNNPSDTTILTTE